MLLLREEHTNPDNPFSIKDRRGDVIVSTIEELRVFRDQLLQMFPLEPTKERKKVEAATDGAAPRIFIDTRDRTPCPFKLKMKWLTEEELIQLYNELREHFGDAQPAPADDDIDWEKRRWKAAKAFMAVNIPLEIYSTVDPENIANASIAQADELIARYQYDKKEQGKDHVDGAAK